MDVVYVLGQDATNDELRYSLRSLRNFPHDDVWLVGYRPPWTRNVKSLLLPQRQTKWENSTANIVAACENPSVSDPFVYFNDDFFVMKPFDEPPVMHRGPVEQVIERYARRYGSNDYIRGAYRTVDFLQKRGISPILSYELHAPMVIEKEKMLEALRLIRRHRRPIKAIHKRTLYGNLWDVGGEETHDFKVSGPNRKWSTDWPFLSTIINTFNEHEVGAHIRREFPEPSKYERLDHPTRWTTTKVKRHDSWNTIQTRA